MWSIESAFVKKSSVIDMSLIQNDYFICLETDLITDDDVFEQVYKIYQKKNEKFRPLCQSKLLFSTHDINKFHDKLKEMNMPLENVCVLENVSFVDDFTTEIEPGIAELDPVMNDECKKIIINDIQKFYRP